MEEQQEEFEELEEIVLVSAYDLWPELVHKKQADTRGQQDKERKEANISVSITSTSIQEDKNG